MRVALVTIIAGLGGCIGILPPGGLPAVPYHSLPGDPADLRRLADRVHATSRTLSDLVRARTALKKADRLKPATYATLWRLARIDGVLARVDAPRAADWAEEGRQAGAAARKLRDDRPEGHLYYAICTGIYAQHRAKEATVLLNEVIEVATRSNERDASYARGEARRLLGALYVFAPAWPTGVGDLDEGIAVLEALAAEFPDEPLTLYFLAEAYRKAERRVDARRLYLKVLEFPPKGPWRLEGRTYRPLVRKALSELRRGP